MWERGAKLIWPYAWKHTPLFRILEIVRDPVDDGMPVPAEFIGLHRHKYRVFALARRLRRRPYILGDHSKLTG